MLPEDMLKELYKELNNYGIGSLTIWEEDFIENLYEKIIINEFNMTEKQEMKIENIYNKAIG